LGIKNTASWGISDVADDSWLDMKPTRRDTGELWGKEKKVWTIQCGRNIQTRLDEDYAIIVKNEDVSSPSVSGLMIRQRIFLCACSVLEITKRDSSCAKVDY
jgi:hypothetical protein